MTPSSDGEASAGDKAVEFTDRELALIAVSLPKGVEKRRLDLLPQILRHWGRMDLPGHLRQKPEPVQARSERRKRLTRIELQTKQLSESLTALDRTDWWQIIVQLACPAERYPLGLSEPNIERAKRGLKLAREWLPRLSAAAHAGTTIPLVWRDKVLVAEAAPTGVVGSIERRAVKAVFIELLDKITDENRYASDSKHATNYAPKLFAGRSGNERYKEEDFRRAMEELFDLGEIHMRSYGVKGHQHRRIVRIAKHADE